MVWTLANAFHKLSTDSDRVHICQVQTFTVAPGYKVDGVNAKK